MEILFCMDYRCTATILQLSYILEVSHAPFGPHALPHPFRTSPTWCHCLTKQGCIAGCGLLCAPTAVAMTRVTLHARDSPTRSRGTLRRRRPLTVELRRARSSIHPRARNYGGPRWRWSHSSEHRHKRSFSPLASRVVSAIPRQARRGASGGPLRPRQSDIDRPRPTFGASATTPRALK